ncbi:HNH endonuclease signature motif containing protein [Paenibacillus sp. FSL K6-3166]|uniref:HNH endonuclease signature motif containing protein n=1 Tax=unclassified Paenibacillus TaxID=185978 RepID=UPI000BA003C7|nr:HNH endonuclease signature motif containing protein [Paenibacillus sp. VTT E-133291]OZQ88570.1 hypothetical protein CA598_15215 [Paenibacillus sp. VTT E-133291]
MNNRIPPTEIRRKLRKEVGFGCPIKGCMSPFLEYHHFDPPWHEGHTHNTEGMIALCPSHHSMADRETWTREELKMLKIENEIKSVKGKLHWNLRDSIVNAGSNFIIIKDRFSLRVLKNEIFGLSENENGQITLNALLWNQFGEVIIQIIDNDIIVAPNKVDDFVCNASGNKIRIESKENQTYLEFTIKREKVRKLGEFLTNEYNLQQGKIPFITLKAKVTNRLFDLAIQEKQIILDFRKYGFDKASLSDRTIGPSGSLNIVSQGNELLHIG